MLFETKEYDSLSRPIVKGERANASKTFSSDSSWTFATFTFKILQFNLVLWLLIFGYGFGASNKEKSVVRSLSLGEKNTVSLFDKGDKQFP